MAQMDRNDPLLQQLSHHNWTNLKKTTTALKASSLPAHVLGQRLLYICAQETSALLTRALLEQNTSFKTVTQHREKRKQPPPNIPVLHQNITSS